MFLSMGPFTRHTAVILNCTAYRMDWSIVLTACSKASLPNVPIPIIVGSSTSPNGIARRGRCILMNSALLSRNWESVSGDSVDSAGIECSFSPNSFSTVDQIAKNWTSLQAQNQVFFCKRRPKCSIWVLLWKNTGRVPCFGKITTW